MAQSRFHKDDDGNLHEQISREAYVEELAAFVERCRIAAAGGTLILAMIVGAIGFNTTTMIGAMAAVIGGTVVLGSNANTLKETTIDIKAAEVRRAELISRMDVRVVEDGKIEAARGARAAGETRPPRLHRGR